jgi:hypothetical protein
MIDLHRAFTDWVIDGAPGEPQRVVAVHASACPECQALVEAFDELSRIEIGASPLPAMPAAVRRPRLAASRIERGPAAVFAAALLVGTAAVAFSNGVLPAGSQPTPRPAVTEGVLGGTASAGSDATATPTASESARPSASPSESADEPDPTAAASTIAPPPPVVATPQPSVAPTAVPTARPTPIPTPRPTTPPTPSPTAVPTPEPTLTPLPVPDDCQDGVDNDDDLLVDAADPGCLLNGNETSA